MADDDLMALREKELAELREKLDEEKWKAADAERRLDDAHSEIDLFEPVPPRKTLPDATGAVSTLTVAGRLKRLRDLLAPDLVRGRHYASMPHDIGRAVAEMSHRGGRPYAVLVSDAVAELPLHGGNIGLIMDLGATTDEGVVAIAVMSAASLARGAARGLADPATTTKEDEREMAVAILEDALRLVKAENPEVSGYARRRSLDDGETNRG